MNLEEASAALQTVAARAQKIDCLDAIERNGHGRPNVYIKGWLTLADLKAILAIMEAVK